MKIEKSSSVFCGVIMALLGAGCASVSVYKVNTDSTNGNETVDTSVQGIPYYMPRPYLDVYEPFVISVTPYFVRGQISPDGKYLTLQTMPPALGDINADAIAASSINASQGSSSSGSDNALEGATPNSGNSTPSAETLNHSLGNIGLAISLGSGGGGSGTQNSSSKGNGQGQSQGSGQGSGQQGSGQGQGTDQQTGQASNAGNSKTGVTIIQVSSNSDFYITPGRRFFDIVYLPDYSDKRIIQVKEGLGNANLSVVLAQGWSLAALNSQVDNSQLTKALLDTYETGLQLAQKAAEVSLFPPSALEGAVPNTKVAGVEVSCKLMAVTMVAPGLYPLPKDLVYPQKPDANGNTPSLMDRLGLKTYTIYVIQALTPTGDSPLNFTPYGNPPPLPGASSGNGTGNNKSNGQNGAPSPTPTPTASEIQTKVLNFINKSAPGKPPFDFSSKNVVSVVSTVPSSGTVTLTVGMNQVPAENDLAPATKQLTDLANSVLSQWTLSVDKLNVQKPISSGAGS